MNNPPLVVGITSLPSRVSRIRPTLESLLAGDRQPDRIILSLPQKSRREGVGYDVPKFLGETPFSERVEVVRPAFDWGPGTKTMGALEAINTPSVLIVADDDIRYRKDFLHNLHEAQSSDQRSSFSHYVYEVQGMSVGQGCDRLSFWTPNLARLREFAERHVVGTRLMLHDDLWVSFFLAGRGIRIRSLEDRLGDGLIYEQVYELNALRNLAGNDARDQLTREALRRLLFTASLPLAVRTRLAAGTAKEEARQLVRRLRRAHHRPRPQA